MLNNATLAWVRNNNILFKWVVQNRTLPQELIELIEQGLPIEEKLIDDTSPNTIEYGITLKQAHTIASRLLIGSNLENVQSLIDEIPKIEKEAAELASKMMLEIEPEPEELTPKMLGSLALR
jgi:hypothetical protein